MEVKVESGQRPHVKMDLGQLAQQGTIKDSRLVSHIVDKPAPKVIKESMKWLSTIPGGGAGTSNYNRETIVTCTPNSLEDLNRAVQILLDNNISYTCFEGCIILKKNELYDLIYE